MRNQIHINYLFVESKWTYLLKQQNFVRLTPKILFIPSKNAGFSIAVTCLRFYAEWRHHPVSYLECHRNCSTEYLTRPLGNVVKDKRNFFCISQIRMTPVRVHTRFSVCVHSASTAPVSSAPPSWTWPQGVDLKEFKFKVVHVTAGHVERTLLQMAGVKRWRRCACVCVYLKRLIYYTSFSDFLNCFL